MAYEWKTNELDPMTGLPFSKGPNVVLEKDGQTKKFKTQEEVDAAWADGWHEPDRPETADTAIDPPEKKVKQKKPPAKRKPKKKATPKKKAAPEEKAEPKKEDELPAFFEGAEVP